MFLKNQKARKKKKKQPASAIATMQQDESEEMHYEDIEGNGDESKVNSRPTKQLGAVTETKAVLDISREFGISAPYSSDLIGSEMFRLTHLEGNTQMK